MNRFKHRNFDSHHDSSLRDRYANPFLSDDSIRSNSLYDSSVYFTHAYVKNVGDDGVVRCRRVGDVELAYGTSADVTSSVSPESRRLLRQSLLSMPHNLQSSDVVQHIGRLERHEICESVSNCDNYLNNIQTDEQFSIESPSDSAPSSDV